MFVKCTFSIDEGCKSCIVPFIPQFVRQQMRLLKDHRLARAITSRSTLLIIQQADKCVKEGRFAVVNLSKIQ